MPPEQRKKIKKRGTTVTMPWHNGRNPVAQRSQRRGTAVAECGIAVVECGIAVVLPVAQQSQRRGIAVASVKVITKQ